MSHLPGQDVDEQLHPDDPLYNDIYAQVRARYEFVDRLLGGAQRLLEIGSGKGVGSHYLSLPPTRDVLAVDADPESVAFANTRYGHRRLRFEHAVAPDLPPAPSPFDAIVCLEVIEHVQDDRGLLQELKSRLGTGGQLIVSTPNRLLTSPGCPPDQPKNPYHVREYDPAEFEALLSKEFGQVRLFGQRLRRDRRAFMAPMVEGLNHRLDALEGRVERMWLRYRSLLESTRSGALKTVARMVGGRGGQLFADAEEHEQRARTGRNSSFFQLLTPFVQHAAADWEFEPREYSRAVALLAVCEA